MKPIDKHKELMAYASYLDEMEKTGRRPVAIVFAQVTEEGLVEGVGYYNSQDTALAPTEFYTAIFSDIVANCEAGKHEETIEFKKIKKTFNTDN